MDEKQSKIISVTNVPATIKRKQLRSHFSVFGDIKKISYDSTKSVYYISFRSISHAKAAKEYGTKMNNYDLKIDFAEMNYDKLPTFDLVDDNELNWGIYTPFQNEPFNSDFNNLPVSVDPIDDNKLHENVKTKYSLHKDNSNQFENEQYNVDYYFRKKDKDSNRPEIIKTIQNKESKIIISKDINIEKLDTTKQNIGKVTKSNLLLEDKLHMLNERDKVLRTKIEKAKNIKTASIVVGTCPDMCPEKERIMRALKGMISPYEFQSNSNDMNDKLAVKEYSRSSADQEEPLPHELRPEPVLTMTMAYLINKVMTKIDTNTQENLVEWYDFCWNRLRAIRKDIIQQQLCDLKTVNIVEQCARFHICCLDRFWGADSSIFDEKLNLENLMNCLQSLRYMYDDLRKRDITCPAEAEFKSYTILLKVNSGELLWEYQNFPYSIQVAPEMIDAIKIYSAYNNNLYSLFFKLIHKTSYLNSCLLQRFFTQIRSKALFAITKAYYLPKKGIKITKNSLMKYLKFDSFGDLVLFCDACGLSVNNDGTEIEFSKGDFTYPDVQFRIQTPSSLILRKRVSCGKAVVGKQPIPQFIEHEVHVSFNKSNRLSKDAIDASDQEEKMLRDDYVRQLELKQIISVESAHELENLDETNLKSNLEVREISSEDEVGDFTDDNDDDSNEIAEIPGPVFQEYDKETYTEYDVINNDSSSSMQIEVNTNSSDNSDSSESDESISDQIIIDYYDETSPISSISSKPQLSEDEFDEKLSNKSFVSEIEMISSNTEDSEIQSTHEDSLLKEESTHLGNENLNLNVSKNDDGLLLVSPDDNDNQSKNKQKNDLDQVQLHSIENKRKTEKDEIEEMEIMKKLRHNLSKNLKKICAKKYARIWRDKIKNNIYNFSSNKDVFPFCHNIPVNDYLDVWGLSNQSYEGGVIKWMHDQSKVKKQILNFFSYDLLDTNDDNFKDLGQKMAEILGSDYFMSTRRNGVNFHLLPVLWKLLIYVPDQACLNLDFLNQIYNWCKFIFYPNSNNHVKNIGQFDVPNSLSVFIKVQIVKGSTDLSLIKNMSAFLYFRAIGWEDSAVSVKNILNTLQNCRNQNIPIAVINLGTDDDKLNMADISFSYYEEINSVTNSNVKELLMNLAKNYSAPNLKLHTLFSFLDVNIDKFIDAVYEDNFKYDYCFITTLYPNDVVNLFNEFLNKLENILIEFINLYATEIEMASMIDEGNSIISDELEIKQIIQQVKLKQLEWPIESSNHLLKVFRNYCQDNNVPFILSNLVRLINPPDVDRDNLNSYLIEIEWLRIIEMIVKAKIYKDDFVKKIFCDDKKIIDLIKTHWWIPKDEIMEY